MKYHGKLWIPIIRITKCVISRYGTYHVAMLCTIYYKLYLAVFVGFSETQDCITDVKVIMEKEIVMSFILVFRSIALLVWSLLAT